MGSYIIAAGQVIETPLAHETTKRRRREARASRAPMIVIASAVGLIAFLALMLLVAGVSFGGCQLPVKASADADAARYSTLRPVLEELARHLPPDEGARLLRTADAWAVDLRRGGTEIPASPPLPESYRAAFAPIVATGTAEAPK